jgi:GT2 family glycosyltransferase
MTTSTVGVVIACYSQRRWAHLVAAVGSALDQARPAAQVAVVVDHNEPLLARARDHFAGEARVRVLPNLYARGASGARNTGVQQLSTDLVAFLDDDTSASRGWLKALCEPLDDDPDVVGTGGGVEADWPADGQRPAWFPPEFDWVIGASYRGMPTETAQVRNVWAENMAVRRSVFLAVEGFRVGFGKLGGESRPEDTDLCLRMAAAVPGGRWVYQPQALVTHAVPPERSTFRFFLRRCYAEGRGKSELARLIPPDEALSSERDYLRRVIPAAATQALHGLGAPGWGGRAARSGSTVTGIAAAGVGFVDAEVRRRLGGRSR